MKDLYDRAAPKKATNLSVNRDLLRQARELGVNLSTTLEQRLAEILAERRRRDWLAENAEAIDAYNRRVAANGALSDRQRRC